MANLADLFEAAADQAPERHAVVTAGVDPARTTYAALDERANRLAHVLAGRGIGAGDRVGVLLGDGHEHLEALLACFKLRAVPVNLNARYVGPELAALLDHSRTRLVLAEPELADLIEVPVLCRGEGWEAALAGADAARPTAARSGNDTYVLWTGGTTGRPRGVVWRHDDLVAAALGQLPPGRRTLVACPLSHGTGQWLALATLLGAGTVLLDRRHGFDAAATLDLAEAERASFVVVVGDAFARPILDALDASPGRWTLDALNVVISGGAPLSAGVRAALLDRLPWAMVVDGFGSSETGGQGRMVAVAATGAQPTRFVPDDGTEVLRDDLRAVLPRESDEEGWVARRGAIPVGYEGDPDATAAAFPTVAGERWAVPGDRARWDDGSLVLLGRSARTINTGGEKVHAEEVEEVLLDHPAVEDAVVVGAPDERWGERVTAVVASGAAIGVEDVARHCRGRLAPFKVPKAVVLVDRVRRTAAGKPDVRWARRVAAG